MADHSNWIETIKARLAAGGYASADDYYQDKDRLRELQAAQRGVKAWELDPAGHWFGRQSN